MSRDFTAPFNLLDLALRLIDCAELHIQGVRDYPLKVAVIRAGLMKLKRLFSSSSRGDNKWRSVITTRPFYGFHQLLW